MSKNRIKVMLSSRNRDPFPAGGPSLSDTRTALKMELEAATLLGQPFFEVWINELAPADEGTQDSWDTCMREVRECDILIVLSNGGGGWSARPGDIGICHAEMMTGLSTAPGKVYLISLGNLRPGTDDQGQRDRRFQEYLTTQSLFRGAEASSVEELKARVRQTVAHAVVSLTAQGVRAARNGRYDLGDALAWAKFGFADRATAITSVLQQTLVDNGGRGDNGLVRLPRGSEQLAVRLSAAPAAMSVAAAREAVGRPFLSDHTLDGALGTAVGPIHIIGCYQGATETQARQLLGFPDAIFVAGPFGTYVADEVQAVQFVFLPHCRDESMTRHALQRFLDWLDQSGEGAVVLDRAVSRRRIIAAVAAEAARRQP